MRSTPPWSCARRATASAAPSPSRCMLSTSIGRDLLRSSMARRRVRASSKPPTGKRLTVMAALILADELSEAHKRMHKVEEEFSVMQQVRAAAADRSVTADAELAAAFNSAAERIEQA